MPIYSYQCEKCGAVEDSYRLVEFRNDPLPCVGCCGHMIRCLANEVGGVQTDWVDPLLSDAAGVHPDQVADARSRFKHHEYTDDGRMIFRSKKHRDRCLKDIGMHDKDGFG